MYTYNGTRFDLPFIEEKLGVAVERKCRHEDLMYRCWERGLFGGLKVVEQLLRIPRLTSDIDGWMAVQLWHRFSRQGDRSALQKLLAYNREDVLNLSKIRLKLLNGTWGRGRVPGVSRRNRFRFGVRRSNER